MHQPSLLPSYGHKIFPVIDLGDYILREQQEKDVQNFFTYYTDPIVNKYILTESPATIEDARRELYYWRNVFYNNDGIYFAIATKDTDQMIGAVGFSGHNAYHSRIELSYDMAKEFWRQGIMTKAIKATLEYGFKTLRVNRIEAITSIYNEPSIRLLEKCNFKYEGCLRQHRYHRGKFVDVYSFSVLKEEYFADMIQKMQK